MKVLIVEDCEMNALVVTGFLRKYDKNVEIVCAENGQIGVDKSEAEDFDIIFMDINMPVMDGITATTHIKKSKNDANIVAVTCVGIDHFKERNALSMFDNILFKPLDFERFIKTVDNICKPTEDRYSHT